MKTTRVPAMTGTELQDTVIGTCQVMHLYVAHFRPALTKKGWRTPVQGNGEGFPDLVIVGPGGVLWREVKMATESTTTEQDEWLARLLAAGQDAGIWRPVDLRSGRIQTELTALRRGTR